MPRNLDTRVELLAPVDDPALRDDLLDTLERCLADDTNAWELGADGAWTRRTPAGPRAALRAARADARPRGARGRGHLGRLGTAASLSASSRAAPALQQACPVARSALSPSPSRCWPGAWAAAAAPRTSPGRASRARARSRAAQMLFGTLVNRSARPLQLRAADVRVLDRNGHALPAAAAFSGGYNAGIALRGFGAEMFAAATPRRGRRREGRAGPRRDGPAERLVEGRGRRRRGRRGAPDAALGCRGVAPADGPLADIHIRAPTRGNRRLEQLLEAVNGDLQVKAWWHMAGVNAAAPRAHRPLVGPHPDRHEHRAAPGAAAVPPRHHAGDGRRPRDDRARRRGRRSPPRRCSTASACRSTASTTRPTRSSSPPTSSAAC